MNNLLIDLHASLLKLAATMATQVAPLTGSPTGAVYFDTYADEDVMPSGDQVGITGLTFQTDAHLVEGSFMIGMTTQTDKNLFRLMKGMNHLLKALIPGSRLVIVDGATGLKAGMMNVVDDTRLMPVGGKSARPVQLIQVNFITTTSYVPEE